ncbi:hypothetical protein J6590_001936 [Homalodisca vitripennis]|nr:hypothetical protein J6590_001936 [Homalodisca vitripennis]
MRVCQMHTYYPPPSYAAPLAPAAVQDGRLGSACRPIVVSVVKRFSPNIGNVLSSQKRPLHRQRTTTPLRYGNLNDGDGKLEQSDSSGTQNMLYTQNSHRWCKRYRWILLSSPRQIRAVDNGGLICHLAIDGGNISYATIIRIHNWNKARGSNDSFIGRFHHPCPGKPTIALLQPRRPLSIQNYRKVCLLNSVKFPLPELSHHCISPICLTIYIQSERSCGAGCKFRQLCRTSGAYPARRRPDNSLAKTDKVASPQAHARLRSSAPGTVPATARTSLIITTDWGKQRAYLLDLLTRTIVLLWHSSITKHAGGGEDNIGGNRGTESTNSSELSGSRHPSNNMAAGM